MEHLRAVESAQDAVARPHLPHDHAEAVHIGGVRQVPGLQHLRRAVRDRACAGRVQSSSKSSQPIMIDTGVHGSGRAGWHNVKGKRQTALNMRTPGVSTHQSCRRCSGWLRRAARATAQSLRSCSGSRAGPPAGSCSSAARCRPSDRLHAPHFFSGFWIRVLESGHPDTPFQTNIRRQARHHATMRCTD